MTIVESALDAATQRRHTATVALLKQHLATEKVPDQPQTSEEPSNTNRNRLESLAKKQKATSKALQNLTAQLNDTANTTEALRREVAALQLRNSDGKEIWQKLSDLQTT